MSALLTVSEMLAALTNGVQVKMCPLCHGTGTKFGGNGKSRPCPKCKGRRKLVVLHRDPQTVPFDDEWQAFLNLHPSAVKK